MKLYMAVTADKYELPLAVCDNVQDLSRKTGFSVGNIKTEISRDKRNQGRSRGIKFIKVEVEEN